MVDSTFLFKLTNKGFKLTIRGRNIGIYQDSHIEIHLERNSYHVVDIIKFDYNLKIEPIVINLAHKLLDHEFKS